MAALSAVYVGLYLFPLLLPGGAGKTREGDRAGRAAVPGCGAIEKAAIPDLAFCGAADAPLSDRPVRRCHGAVRRAGVHEELVSERGLFQGRHVALRGEADADPGGV